MTARIEQWICVFCDYKMDAVDCIGDEGALPSDGDLCVCLKCASPYSLHGGKFVPTTDDELIDLPLDVKEKLSMIQNAIRQVDNMTKSAKELLLQGKRHNGYTLYKNPTEAPGRYVLRGWDMVDGRTVHSAEAIASPINPATLRTIRETMKAMGLLCMGRMNADDPVVVEVWI